MEGVMIISGHIFRARPMAKESPVKGAEVRGDLPVAYIAEADVASEASLRLPVKHPPSMVKNYYIGGEFYDWVTDPRRFERVFHWLRARATVALFARHAVGTTTADVGCGTGLIAGKIGARTVIGLDINRWNLQRAQEHRSDIRSVQADAERLPLSSARVDTIVCTETLEHLVEPRQALREMLRVLRPSGKLIGSVPSRSWIWKTRHYILSTCPGSEPFHNHYTLSEARALLHLPSSRILELYPGVLGLSIFFVLQKDGSTRTG